MKKNLLKLLLVNFFVLFVSVTAFAQTNYYVSETSGSDGNTGLTGFPKKTIQAAVNVSSAGDIINVGAGTYNELVVVNKALTIDGADKSTRTLRYTGVTISNGIVVPALFTVAAKNVTIKNLNMEVDLSKIWSAVITSGEVAGLLIKDNNIKAVRTAATNAAGYTDRNALGLNVSGRAIPGTPGFVNTPIGIITVQGNVISYSPDGGFGVAAFRAGVAADNYSVVVGGNTLAEGNTIQTINHDVTNRFQGTAFQTILKNNTFNGGGIELSETNSGSIGTLVEDNNFNYLFPTAPFALVRLKNNNANKPFILKNNIFSNHYWLVSLENFQNVTLDGNTFSPILNGGSFRSLTINTKTNSSSSNTKQPISATIVSNTFNGVPGAVNSNAISFLNHDSNGALFGNFVIGDVGKYNTFNDNHTNYIYVDNSNGVPTQTASVGLSGYPEYGEFPATTTAYWASNIKADLNNFYVDGSLRLPYTLTVAQRNLLDDKIFDKKDNVNIGEVQYFFTIRNLNTNEGFATLQEANDGVNTLAGHIINVDAGTYTLTNGFTITKEISLIGNNNVLATKPVITGAGNATNKTLIEVNSQNVRIQNFEFQIAQTGNAMIGVGTTSTDNFNYLEIADNIFKGTKPFTAGYVFESYGIKLGRGSAGIGNIPKNQVLVVRNATTYANLVTPELFGRGIYAYNTSGKIGGSFGDANSLAAVYALQAGEIGSSSSAFEFSYNQVLGGLVSIFGAAPGNHLINNNMIGSAVTAAQAPLISRMVEIKGNRTAGANIEFANNTVSNYTNIGVFVQRSSNVTLKDNAFNPLVDNSNTNFISVAFSSKEGTSSASGATTLQNLTITGNTFDGSGAIGGSGISFYNHQAAVGVKPLTGAKIGGAGALQNIFNASHNAYIVLDATPAGTTAAATPINYSILYDEPQTVANTTNILPFNGDIDAAYNTFGSINTETETVFDNLAAVKAKITDGVDNSGAGYVNIQPQKAFIASLGNLSNALAAVPDNFTLILKNDAAVYGNLGGSNITKAHTFAIDNNAVNEIVFNGLTVNAPSKEVKFTNAVGVTGSFTLTAGKITPALGMRLNGAVNTTVGSGNFVNGDLTVNGVTSNILFPVGKTTAAYIALTNVTGTSSNFTVKYFNSSAGSIGSFDPTLGSVSTSEYWNLDRTSGDISGKVALYTYDQVASNLTSFGTTDASVAWYNGTTWKDQGNAGNPIATAIQANVSNANFGFFTFAKTQVAVLPISLVDFSAKATAAGALLTWSTSQEKDNAKFELEKSFDGINFQKIGEVNGAINSSTTSNYQFLDKNFTITAYYRLSQTDINGKKVTYTDKTRLVKGFAGDVVVTTYPNPTTSSVFVNISSNQKENVQVKLIDVMGRVYKTLTAEANQQVEIKMDGAAPGVYTLQLSNSNTNIFKKIIKQ